MKTLIIALVLLALFASLEPGQSVTQNGTTVTYIYFGSSGCVAQVDSAAIHTRVSVPVGGSRNIGGASLSCRAANLPRLVVTFAAQKFTPKPRVIDFHRGCRMGRYDR